MTPQIQDNFNGGVWENLESTVRSWANSSDTVYVVTGCMVDETLGYVLDNDGKHVSVPSAYYKAILRYQKNSTVGYDGYAACGVYLEHKEYSSNSLPSGSVMSIDALEEMTGMDFFVNLPSLIGETQAANVESQNPSSVSWWGL
jgi:endonuclease G